MVEYIGIFVDEDDIDKIVQNERVCLEKRPNNFHCTMQYMPKDLKFFRDMIGKEIVITLIGYGCDGENSGFKVQFPENIKKYFLNTDKEGNLKVPHITTSLSKNGKAVNTMNLKFDDFENPIFIRGKFGCFVKEGGKGYISFDNEKSSIQEMS